MASWPSVRSISANLGDMLASTRTSRSLSQWEFALLNRSSGVFECCADVLELKVGEVGKDLLGRPAGRELTKHGRDRDSQTSDAWNAAHFAGINGDSLELHSKSARETVCFAVAE